MTHLLAERGSATRSVILLCAIDIINENAVPNAGGFARSRHLEGDKFSIVAHHWIRGFIARVITEISEALVVAAPVEFKFPEIHVAGAFQVLLVTFDQRELAI